MKKVILKDSQVDKLMSKVIEEQSKSFRNDDRMHINVICDFDYHRITYNGGEIDDISKLRFDVSYLIEPEWRSYGIKAIYVYGFQGPEEIDAEITYYPQEQEDSIDDMIRLKLDWDNLININEDETLGYIGMDQEMSITLENDEQGGIKVSSINVNVHGF